MNALEIKKMTTEEKMQTIEALWDSLLHDETEMKSPPWHGEVLRETEIRYKSGEESAEDWAESKKKLRRRFE